MKKILLFLIIFSNVIFSKEIFKEFHVMNSILLEIEKGKDYSYKNIPLKAVSVNRKILKSIGTDGDVFYMYDSNGDEVCVKLGDYLLSTPNLSEIYAITKEDFETKIKDDFISELKK